MLNLNLQFFGGRGGSSGGKSGGGSVKTMILGSTGENRRVEKFTPFHDGNGMVKSIDVLNAYEFLGGTHDIEIRTDGYPVYAKLGKVRDSMKRNAPVIVADIQMPKGVSEKQSQYAKKVIAKKLESAMKTAYDGVRLGKIPMQNLIDQVRDFPLLDARTILDRFVNRYGGERKVRKK